jgi:hypothetical protein
MVRALGSTEDVIVPSSERARSQSAAELRLLLTGVACPQQKQPLGERRI